MKVLLCILICFSIADISFAQKNRVVLSVNEANFAIPDTVCVNSEVVIQNNTQNGSTFYWNFCSGSLTNAPVATNLTSANFDLPVFMDLVQSGPNLYAFVVNHTGSLVRMDFGNSYLNVPVVTNLGSLGGSIPFQAEGIEIKQEGANWIGFLIGGQNSNSKLLRLEFGTNIENVPNAVILGNLGNLAFPVDLTIIKDGSNWFGFTVNADNNTITRYSFGTSLTNVPAVTNLGNVNSTMSYPVGFFLVNVDNNYHLFVANRNSSSIARIDFSTSLANTPTAVNLGNLGGTISQPRDITVIRDCDRIFGFATNEGNNSVTRLDFETITSIPSGTNLGTVGGINFPHSISEIFRTGDAVNFFVPNVNSSTVSRFSFTNCNNSSIPSHNGPTPPPFQYSQPGTYNISLFVDDGLPTQNVLCKKIVVIEPQPLEFSFTNDVCNPLTVSFTPSKTFTGTPYWSFGDGQISNSTGTVTHTFDDPGTYTIKYFTSVGDCADTARITLDLSLAVQNIVLTNDTTICFGTTKQLRSVPSLEACWTPSDFLDNPNAQNPVTSTTQDITYYLTSKITGANLITNGNFSAGNTGFTSDYEYLPSSGVDPGKYNVSGNITAWHPGMANCSDHTTGSGNMMMVNGAAIAGEKVWSQTVTVTPNTNYAFSAWLQHITSVNPARLQFSINGNPIGSVFVANNTSCIWEQFYEVWNSGNNTTAIISIINQNIVAFGNDFALDDIEFAPFSYRKDSVIITVEKPEVTTIDDIAVCQNTPVTLTTTGANTYQWTPATNLSNSTIASPVATPTTTTEYFVTGTTVNGCTAKDSVTITVQGPQPLFFGHDNDVCNPLSVVFNPIGNNTGSTFWSFGDGQTSTSAGPVSHTYASPGMYTVKYFVEGINCADTGRQVIDLTLAFQDIVITPDTTICLGSSKQLRTIPSLDFCWSPTSFLDNANSPNPITSTPGDITYYFTAKVAGTNLITNGDFSAGNTGFTSDYDYLPSSGTDPGKYNVGSNILSWHPGMANCGDHTTGTGNMLMVNGAGVPGEKVWSQTLTVLPNTQYAFSAWLQHITSVNPARLQFAINGTPIGTIFEANSTSCIWEQFYAQWHSGNNTTAVISIINQNIEEWGNDFALDDISFAPYFIRRDSVIISVEDPQLTTIVDTAICSKSDVTLTTTGASTYVWTPTTGLSDPLIGNPIASPLTSTEYFVTGTTVNGCVATESVMVDVHPEILYSLTPDSTICNASTITLIAQGGNNIVWSPNPTLIPGNPGEAAVSPTTLTHYYVTISDANDCSVLDSVIVDLKPNPVFTINNGQTICENDTIKLSAGGGDSYLWSPGGSIDDISVADPNVYPVITTEYFVTIRDNVCNFEETLSTIISVNPLPDIIAQKSNDIDCSNGFSILSAEGGQTYQWSPSGSLDNPLIQTPRANPIASTEYIVVGTDINGCSNEASVMVEVSQANKTGFFMPNAFTPNNDGLNDCYGVKYPGLNEKFELSIYNRWGERIFHTKNPAACWDGTYKGVKQDIGVYVYMVRSDGPCGGNQFYKGLFTLIR